MKNSKINGEYKNFIELLNFNRGKYNPISVFCDFVVMFAIAIKNAVYYEQKHEDQYLKIIQKYSKQENEVFFKLIDELIYLLCESNQMKDVLGEIYQRIGANSHGRGQVFTPRHIASLMARSVIKKEEFMKNEHISISDPACGAGVMLIEAANALEQEGINCRKKAFMIGQDLDFICVCMTYIQLSIYGIPAAVIHGNTLTQEIMDTFYTPRFVIDGWYKKLRRKEKKNEN